MSNIWRCAGCKAGNAEVQKRCINCGRPRKDEPTVERVPVNPRKPVPRCVACREPITTAGSYRTREREVILVCRCGFRQYADWARAA